MRFRVVEHREQFEPQVWRWWLPFWVPMITGTAAGCDWHSVRYTTLSEAVDAIRRYLQLQELRSGSRRVVHRVENRVA